LVAAWQLRRTHQITLFESADRLGGHTATVEVPHGGRTWAVDTGFIVYNERTYPQFTRLLARLGVATQPTSMSFSVHHEGSGLEYNGDGFNGFFIQRRNLLRPAHYRLLSEVLRFNRLAPELLQQHHWE